MFLPKHGTAEISFFGVALFLILLGAGVFAVGLIGWLLNALRDDQSVFMPSLKIMGGAIIMALGYIHLELEMLRKK